MSKKKIKIRYIIFVLIIIGIVVFVGKITKLDDLNAEKVTEIILVSPPYKKRITDRQEIEEFTSLFNERKKKPVFSIINSSGWSKRAIITTEASIILSILLLSIIAIYLPAPYKKCKFVLDNIEQHELEKIMNKREIVSENDMDKRDEKEHIIDMIERIEGLKKKWLQKKVSLIELGANVETLVDELKKETYYSKVKEYVENAIILDKNIENSESMISNTSMAFVTVMLTINALFLAKNEIEILLYIYLGVAFLFMVGIIVIFYSAMKKYLGKYAREKSFYEILKKHMDQ